MTPPRYITEHWLAENARLLPGGELRLPADEPILRVDARLIHYGYGLDWGEMTKKIATPESMRESTPLKGPFRAAPE